MTREPDEGCGDADAGDGSGTAGTAGAAGSASPDEFDRIVAYWRAEGSVPAWPDTPPAAEPPSDVAPERGAVPREQVPDEPDDDHYHPPEPPPLPRPGPPAIVGAGLIILGLLLVAVPETLGLSSLYGLPLGLLGIAAGLTWLVMRMWPSTDADDPHDDDDDGAIL